MWCCYIDKKKLCAWKKIIFFDYPSNHKKKPCIDVFYRVLHCLYTHEMQHMRSRRDFFFYISLRQLCFSYKTCVCYLIYLKEKEMKAEEKEKHNLSLSFLEKQSNILLYSIDLLVSTMIIEWCGEVRNNKQTTLLKRYLNITPAHCSAQL